MSEPHLLVQVDDRGIANVTLNRPQVLNAFDEALIERIAEAFDRLSNDPDVRVIVLGAAGKAFCAGADIAWMRRAAANSAQANLEDARRFAAMMSTVSRCPKPVVARVQGPAYGGGVGLICAADIAIADKAARFSISEAKFGILPAVIGPYVINAVGLREAKRLALTCAVFDAADALRLGLVHEAVDAAEMDASVDRCVKQLLEAGPQAQKQIKQLFAGQLGMGPVTGEVQELTAQVISRVRSTAEARAGFDSFVEKRPPPWKMNGG